MKCTVCGGKGVLRSKKTCLLCGGSGQREQVRTDKVASEGSSAVGLIVGIFVSVALGLLFGRGALNGMIDASDDGTRAIFLGMAIFSFVIAGFFGGIASYAIAKDDRSLLEHMSLPATMAFVANFASCALGVGNSF